jgi:hypothetical protein
MESMRFVGAIHGAGFGGVVDGEPQSPPPEPQSPKGLPDAIMQAIANVLTDDPAAQREQSILLGERHVLNLKCRQWLAAQLEHAREALVGEHERVKAECRALLEEIAGVEAKIHRLQQDFNKAQEVKGRAMAGEHEAKEALRRLSRFASKQEIAHAERAVIAAGERVAKTSATEAPLVQEMNRLSMTVLPELGEKLRTLEAQERDLSLALEGRGGTDSLGIMHGPR